MARIRDIVFDCGHPSSLARFWASLVEGYAVAPYDEAELDRLRGMGIDDPEDDPTVLVEGPVEAPRLWFQQVPESKAGKNRVHLDLAVDDLGAEIERIEGLGGRRLELQPSDPDLVAMRDPEGNEFCVGATATG